MGNKLSLRINVKHQNCPLCRVEDVTNLYQDKHRNYLRCHSCNIVFVPPNQFLSSEDEKARYDQHQNSQNDQRYRRFLSRLFVPMQKLLSPGSFGLDFGCGPGPTLSVMFEEVGHTMLIYDHFYARFPIVLKKQYDFITATEVVEHLHDPRKELDRLLACLRPGGWLGLMTKLAMDRQAFVRWHYINDPTHVCFFSRLTFEWLATKWQAEIIFADKDVVLFHKRN